MTSLAIETPKAFSVACNEDELTVFLSDGRKLTAPLIWFPRLHNASQSEREQFEILGDGEGIYWESVDEDISVAGLFAGNPSFEYKKVMAD